MATGQRKFGDNNREQNTARKPTNDPSKETSDLSTFDKLILYLTKTHPEYTKFDFTEALYAYRQEQQTLAGLSLSQIEEGLLNIIQKKYPSEQTDIDITQTENKTDDINNVTGSAKFWSLFPRYREREQKTKNRNKTNETTPTEEQCLICLENLSSNKTETFPCQHTFHRICLEEWFKIERTCPLCRKMLLFNDEYPALI